MKAHKKKAAAFLLLLSLAGNAVQLNEYTVVRTRLAEVQLYNGTLMAEREEISKKIESKKIDPNPRPGINRPKRFEETVKENGRKSIWQVIEETAQEL